MIERKKKALPAVAPDHVEPAPVAIVRAFKAMREGKANAHQQRIALDWLLLEASGRRYVAFHGEQTHATSFALGRRFVGDLIYGFFAAELQANPEEG